MYIGDHILIDAEVEGHAVFGPYASIPRGHYEARWLMERSGPSLRMNFEVDVTTERAGILCRRRVKVPAGSTLRDVSLRFEIVHDLDVVEFRIGGGDFAQAPLRFAGVSVALSTRSFSAGFVRIARRLARRARLPGTGRRVPITPAEDKTP